MNVEITILDRTVHDLLNLLSSGSPDNSEKFTYDASFILNGDDYGGGEGKVDFDTHFFATIGSDETVLVDFPRYYVLIFNYAARNGLMDSVSVFLASHPIEILIEYDNRRGNHYAYKQDLLIVQRYLAKTNDQGVYSLWIKLQPRNHMSPNFIIVLIVVMTFLTPVLIYNFHKRRYRIKYKIKYKLNHYRLKPVGLIGC